MSTSGVGTLIRYISFLHLPQLIQHQSVPYESLIYAERLKSLKVFSLVKQLQNWEVAESIK